MTDSTDRPATQTTPEAGDLSWLRGAAVTLRQRWWLIAGCALALLVMAVVYLRGADYSYSVTLRVSPTASAATGRDSGALGALTNLAELTGINIAAIPATPFRLYVEGLRSRTAAACVAQDPTMLPGVFRREWRADLHQWQAPQSIGAWLLSGLNRLAAAPDRPWSPPDAARLQRELATLVTIEQRSKSAVTVVTVDAVDPAFGARLLQRLHICVDGMLRRRALERSQQNIAYLEARLNSVAIADHRQILIATLADQHQRLTVLSNPAAYAAESFGAIIVSPQPTKPLPLAVIIAALGLGLGLGVVLALIVPQRRRA